ncbi:MAG: ATP-binding cassette domain-containing protein [Clostridiaceae bacterium]|nr:ATP-binding cassette domain-containing protein [Clostridiaceae bacterium]
MLELCGVSKTFMKGTANELDALKDVSFTLSQGEFAAIIGGNGSGKSTLLNCISGVYIPDGGSIKLDGEDITYKPEYKRAHAIGRVFQDPLKGTAFDMTIEENLAIAWYKGRPRNLRWGITRKDRELFREKLSRFELGLEDRMKDKAGLLSGGQRQALTLLMAIIVRPKLLLLDEHTAALDPATSRKVLELTKVFVKEEGIPTLMVTHNMKDAIEMSTRILMMNKGKLVLNVSGDDLKGITVDKLVDLFEEKSGEVLDNDRILLG